MVPSTHNNSAVGDRLREVISHMPPGPFSLGDFVNHATGLNALDNCRDVQPFLDRLVSEGLICRLGKNIAMWVVVTDESC